jgi:L-asparaginase
MRKQNWRMPGLALILVLLTQVALSADKLPNVKILATGGTIAGAAAVNTETVSYKSAVFPVETLINAVPEVKKIANVSGEQIAQIGSQDMNNDVWLKLAKRINQLLASNDVDGIVITHGTDTMEETAYFLNLVVKSDKPVVLVGAMRPATAMSADGPLNLYNAVLVAGSKESRGKGVMVVMNDMIYAGRDVTKTNTFRTDTFKSVDLGALGYVQAGSTHFYKLPARKHTLQTPFDVSGLAELPRVDIVYGYANASRAYVDTAAKAGVKGIVNAGVGDGSLYHEVELGLIDAQEQGIVIVRSSRVGNGIVARNGEVDDDKDNFVVSDSLNPQKARVLLMLCLTKTSDPKEIQQMFWQY